MVQRYVFATDMQGKPAGYPTKLFALHGPLRKTFRRSTPLFQQNSSRNELRIGGLAGTSGGQRRRPLDSHGQASVLTRRLACRSSSPDLVQMAQRPADQRIDMRHQALAERCQPVLDPRRHFGIGDPLHQQRDAALVVWISSYFYRRR